MSGDAEWFADGLRFACTGCGRCCSGAKGYVWVAPSEIDALAALLGLDRDEFGVRFLRTVGDRYALLESPTDRACIFLRGAQCSVYEGRPRQCRTYPFWPQHLSSPGAWTKEAAACEGIAHDAPVVCAARIRAYVVR